MPSATTSATLLPPASPLAAAAAPVALALALAPVLLATPDRLPVVPLGLMAVEVPPATDVTLEPTDDDVVGTVSVGRVISVPEEVGVDVSEVGTVKPDSESVVKGMETIAWMEGREPKRTRTGSGWRCMLVFFGSFRCDLCVDGCRLVLWGEGGLDLFSPLIGNLAWWSNESVLRNTLWKLLARQDGWL